MNGPKVCVLAAGRGRRLNQLTESFPKALLPLDNKAAISCIVRQFPAQCGIVVAIGYKGDMIEQYLRAVFPDRDIQFVRVDPWEGAGSGPGYSLMQCRPYLQEPFYLTTVDTIIPECDETTLPSLDGDWIGVANITNPAQYATVQFDGDLRVTDWRNKQADGYASAYIGVAGIKNFAQFWQNLDAAITAKTTDETECIWGWFPPQSYADGLKAVPLPWLDIGTLDQYEYARRLLGRAEPIGLPKKIAEYTYVDNDVVVKLFGDEQKAAQRCRRLELLSDVIPPFTAGVAGYSYKYIEGKNLYELDNADINQQLLHWCHVKLWKQIEWGDLEVFKEACYQFYWIKTNERLEQFLKTRHNSYRKQFKVNGTSCERIERLLVKIPWNELYNTARPTRISGDLNFGNVVRGDDGCFYVIDHRENFGGLVEVGDCQYDAAKLYAGICCSWQAIKEGMYTIGMTDKVVDIWVQSTDALQETKKRFELWAPTAGFNLELVKILAAITTLNMCAIHDNTNMFPDLLYFHSLKELTEILG